MSFEEYLKGCFTRIYTGIDDLMYDRFQDWYSSLDIYVLTLYAENFGQKMYNEGKKEGLDFAQSLIYKV